MNEREFLLTRALAVFNRTYNADVKVEQCDIYSISNDPHSDLAYQITTPGSSEFFRIRYYLTWSDHDSDANPYLGVSMPYRLGELGDEIYVIHSLLARSWMNQEGYVFDTLTPGDDIDGVILTESGLNIVTEIGVYIVLEEAAPL